MIQVMFVNYVLIIVQHWQTVSYALVAQFVHNVKILSIYILINV